jgi:hypothetical protein
MKGCRCRDVDFWREGKVEVTGLNPREETDPLREDVVPLEVVRWRHVTRKRGQIERRCVCSARAGVSEGQTKGRRDLQMPQSVHDELLHRLHRHVELHLGSFEIELDEELFPGIHSTHLASDKVEEVVDDADLIG